MTPISETLPTLTVYGGLVPNKATMSVDEFANAVHPYMNFFNTDSIPEVQAFRTSLNVLAGQMNTIASEVDTRATDAENSAVSASSFATLAVNAVNFQGDWVAGFETVGYALGDIVTYTDGHKYQSKVANNLVEPTTLTNTTEWDFIEAVSPSDLALKAPLVSPTFIGNSSFEEITETVFTLVTSDVDPVNGTMQKKTTTGAETITSINMESGQAVTLILTAPTSVAFTGFTWVTSDGSAPTQMVGKNDTFILYMEGTTKYVAYIGGTV